jgi:hypothetical protein
MASLYVIEDIIIYEENAADAAALAGSRSAFDGNQQPELG